jgi:hypothetical protein
MLRPLADSLWVVDMPHKAFGVWVGARMTVAATGDGLALISPIRLSDEDVAAIHAAGEVKWIIAPNKMHYRFVPDAKQRFPTAKVLAAPGLMKKRPDLPWDGELMTESGALPVGLQPIRIGGMPALHEIAFLHTSSSTLVTTDLIFNITSSDHWLTRWYLKMGKAYGKPSQTTLEKFLVKDKAAMRATREELAGLPFDRVIVAHGDVIETGGRAALAEALAWV